jgi:hypothetical protein
MKLNRSLIAAALVLAAAGTASVAQARDNVYFSIGANVAPGVSIGASNYGYAPRYYSPAPVYYQPAPVYYEPAPVYYEPATVAYYGPQYYDPAVRIQYYWHPQSHRYYYMHHGQRHWR